MVIALKVLAAQMVIVGRRAVGPRVIAVPMLVAPKANVETQRVPSDLAVRAMTDAPSVIASSHANETIGLATERRSVRDTDFGNKSAPFETTRTGHWR